MTTTIKEHLSAELVASMRAQDKQKTKALRLISAAIKQIEVDERIVVDDTRLLVILDKLAKQRRESITQFKAANRNDLVAQEEYELDLILSFLPTPLTESEVASLIEKAMQTLNTHSMADMGKLMAHLKPQLQGRCDMAKVSQIVKSKLH